MLRIETYNKYSAEHLEKHIFSGFTSAYFLIMVYNVLINYTVQKIKPEKNPINGYNGERGRRQ